MSREILGGVEVYRAEPTGQSLGTVVLIHEIWGLVDHICQVADRYAASGFTVIAPDLLSSVGVTPNLGVELMAMMVEPDEEKRLANQTFLRESLAHPAHEVMKFGLPKISARDAGLVGDHNQ